MMKRFFSKKVLKKTVAIVSALVMASMTFTGCQSSAQGVKKVGIMQLVEHPALDASREGFVDALKEEGFVEGENVEFNVQNAQGDQSNLNTMSQLLVQNQSDLILAIATPAAIAVAKETSTIPIMITAVTDPEAAALVESNESPNGNVSGTSDMTPVKQQLDLMLEIMPDVQTLGIYYCSSEVNSEIQANIAKEWADSNGIAYEIATVTQSNDVAQVTEALVAKVDAIYIPTDNLLASSMPLVSKIATEQNVPCIVGEEGQLENGGFITNGINYYDLGKLTGQMAAKVLKGEAQPESMPIQYVDQTEIIINKAVADEIGIEIPESVLSRAARIVE